ncbi:MAG: Hpt domain-containing protein, partial [Lachnospiraceae bacterium]|nr:Hpt domain-containing protein [Lachnospiraceae bacterium]
IHEIRELLVANDIENFTMKIHAVKSSAKLVGADRLSQIAADLEQAGDQKNVEYIRRHIGMMLSLYGETAGSLSPLVKKEEKEGTIDSEHVAGLFAHLRGYVEDCNSEAVGSMLRALDHYNFPGKEQERFDKLKKAYEAMDWVAMTALFDEDSG